MAMSEEKSIKHFQSNVKKTALYSFGENRYCQLGVETNSDQSMAGHR